MPLRFWYATTSKKEWSSLNDIKNDFNSVDYVGNHRFVFNIKGNSYRLIAIISFSAKKVYIRFIGIHAEYDKIQDIQNI
ncbi:type II toxin-antitoxin system HigB family toxin [Belliella kenyensis]|uniref:type II toxin-antitoxin system HigB family toxin n=1 Tax=Belliella kenyensis TaxID=1472724 RepID=UPI00338E4FE2